MAVVETNFESMSGDVAASTLDNAFAQALAALAAASTLMGNNTGGTANAGPLTPAQVYAMLKSSILVEITSFMGGTQGGASWQVLRYQSTENFIVQQTACISSSGVPATGSTTFTIADNGSSIGTIIFSASGAVGAVTISGSPYTLAAGHVLTITGPASADATLANVSFTLGGARG